MSDTAAPPAKRKLDDVLLAMDVVDTLRHRHEVLSRELNAEGREEQLLTRLREIYSAQGIEVSDEVLKEGVKALEERRFLYKPPEPSLSVTLAELYISRDRWLAPLVSVLVALGLGLTAWQVGVAAPAKARAAAEQTLLADTLPTELATLRDQAQAISTEADGGALAETYYQDGISAARSGNKEDAQAAVDNLRTLISDLAAIYDVKVVYVDDASGQNRKSGEMRLYGDEDFTAYYLIVEAIDPAGRALDVTVTSDETGETRRVKTWGQRVTKDTFFAVASDKADDHIIQNNIIGSKGAGKLEPVYKVETPGGAILDWGDR